MTTELDEEAIRALGVVRDYLAGRGEKPAAVPTGAPEGSGQGAPP